MKTVSSGVPERRFTPSLNPPFAALCSASRRSLSRHHGAESRIGTVASQIVPLGRTRPLVAGKASGTKSTRGSTALLGDSSAGIDAPPKDRTERLHYH